MMHDDRQPAPGHDPAADTQDDLLLLDGLRSMWLDRDRAPEGLVAAVVARMAASDLDRQWELLSLVDATDRLAGVRAVDGPRTLTFSRGDFTVVVRVGILSDDRRRIDGWVVPPSPLGVQVRRGASEVAGTTAADDGRFEVADVPAGTVTLWFGPDDDIGPDDPTQLHLVSPPFDL